MDSTTKLFKVNCRLWIELLFCHHLKHLTLISGSKEDWDRDIKIFYLIVFGYAVALFIGRLLGEVSFKKDWLEIMKNIAYKEKIEEAKSYEEALALAKQRTED